MERLSELSRIKCMNDEEREEHDELKQRLAEIRFSNRNKSQPQQKKGGCGQISNCGSKNCGTHHHLNLGKKVSKPIKSNVVKIPHGTQREHTRFGKIIEAGIKKVIEHFKEKPITYEELQQLKLKHEKYKYLAGIAKSKATIRKSNANRFSMGSTPGVSSRKSNSNIKHLISPERSVANLLHSAVKGSGRQAVFSSGSRNIRKTFFNN